MFLIYLKTFIFYHCFIHIPYKYKNYLDESNIHHKLTSQHRTKKGGFYKLVTFSTVSSYSSTRPHQQTVKILRFTVNMTVKFKSKDPK